EIRVALVADISTPFDQSPPQGLNSEARGLMAWAQRVNAHGGLAGRRVVVDVYDSKFNPIATNSAVATACAQDFAMLGTETLAATGGAEVSNCPNMAGVALGIPDVYYINIPPTDCGQSTVKIPWTVNIQCSSAADATPTYAVPTGPVRYQVRQAKAPLSAFF